MIRETTCVAEVGVTEHQFRGFNLFDDLGDSSLSELLTLAITGARPSEEEARAIDAVAAATCVADPRIWPLKIVRVATAHGNYLAGAAVGSLLLDSKSIGSLLASRLAEALAAEIPAGEAPNDEALSSAASRLVDRIPRLPGFGVPFREQDERIPPLLRSLSRLGRADRRYVRFFLAAAREVTRRTKVHPNALGLSTAVLLDTGVPPRLVGHLLFALVHVAQLANAAEGAERASEALKRLPDEVVQYDGPPRRVSPRRRAREDAKPL